MTSPPEPFQVLLFSRTTAYRHESIPAAIRAISNLAVSSPSTSPHPTPHPHNHPPFTLLASETPTIFTPALLSPFRVIILLQCSGEFLNASQLAALKGFVRSGGGVVGIHCASAAMESDEWYGRLIGGVFDWHPKPARERVRVVDGGHAALGVWREVMKGRGQGEGEGEWEWMDEWYRFKGGTEGIKENMQVLMAGGDLGRGNPVVWCQEFEGGRSFYTSLGHFDEAYEDKGFIAQVLGGILWTAGVC